MNIGHIQLKARNTLIAAMPGLAEILEDFRFIRVHLRKYRKEGFKLPLPSLLKRTIIKTEAHRINAQVFVETGTYYGDTIWFLREDFSRIYSIEIEPELAKIAHNRFKRFPHIKILEGDSSVILKKIINSIDKTAVFWLDGHYCGGVTGKAELECPIWAELDAFQQLSINKFSILIDDARLFGVDRDYPQLKDMIDYLSSHFSGHNIKVENDIIFVRWLPI